MMRKVSKGDNVGVVVNGEVKKGVVVNVYSDLDYAIVKFEDGLSKVMLHNIGLLPEEKDQDPEPKKPVEKSEITITPEEFQNVGVKVCTKLSEKFGPGFVLRCSVILAGLHMALFIEGEND